MKLAYQVALGLSVAAGLLVALQSWVSRSTDREAGPGLATRRALPSDTAAGTRRVLQDLQGVATGFDLAVLRDDLPPGCAPILAIGVDGAIRIVAPAPLSKAPGRNVWPRLGILLPKARLAEVGASARASLLSIWSDLPATQPIDPASVRLHGCQAQPGEIRRLLRWLR